jgi:regulator of protease activity HflC (stomatin/prohibitin superfamily)
MRINLISIVAFIILCAASVLTGTVLKSPYIIIGGVIFAVLFSLAIRVPKEWERMLVLRVGKFHKMGGPGLFFIIPIIDSVPYVIDLRIIPYEVPSQKTLTNDNIPVTVDAIVYYKVADAEAAVLKVENYKKAIQFGAATALRDLIGKTDLDNLLAERETLSETIKIHLDVLSSDWGIKVSNVEIRDVSIPEKLEDAIAREAEAEREKRARVKLAEAEKITAQTICDAAKIYESDPVALQLRSMNMLYEMCLQGQSTVIFVPTETRLGMPSLGVLGVADKITDLIKPTGS